MSLPVKKDSTQKDLYSKLLKAKELMDNDTKGALSMSGLAREATLSEFHFYRCFKEAFGTSPYQYYLNRKANKAAFLVLSSGMDLTQIAHELGFSELSTFSRFFKKRLGLSPAAYKKIFASTKQRGKE